MTATLLSFGAIVVDKTADTIRRALDSIKTQDVYDWVKRNDRKPARSPKLP